MMYNVAPQSCENLQSHLYTVDGEGVGVGVGASLVLLPAIQMPVKGYLQPFGRSKQLIENKKGSVLHSCKSVQCRTTIMDISLGTLLLSGAVSNSYRSNPSPHPTNNVGRVYPEIFLSFNFV